MSLLYPSQNIRRYISSAKWPQGLDLAFISDINTVWPLQPVYPGPDRKNPVITSNTSSLSVSKMEEHRYLHQLRTRVEQSLPDAEDMETLEPWARLPADGFQFHPNTRMDIWPADSYNLATRVLATASIFATLALSSYKGVFSVSVTEYRNPNSSESTNNTDNDNNTRASISAYEALGPNGSMTLLYKDFLPDGSEGPFQRRVLTYFWFDRNVFTADVLDAFTSTQRAPREGPLKLTGMLRDWIWTRCNMNDTQFWCLGTGEQMLYGWCDWNSNTIYTTKRFACDEKVPTLLEMSIYWIVEAFTEHPDLADWHEFPGSTGVKARCKQVPQIAGWMPTIAMNGQVVTGHPSMPHIVINASGGTGMGMGTGGMGMGMGGSNATTSTATNHSHIPITNASTSHATVRGSPNPAAAPVSRKRRLEEEEEEADNDKHRTRRRKFTHSYGAASDGYSSGYESSHQDRHYRPRPMHKDLHRDLRHAASQVAVSGGHRPTSRPASKSASKAASKSTSRRSKRRTTTRSVSEDSWCECGSPNCEKPFFIPMRYVGPLGGPRRAFDASESSSDSGRCSPRAYMELYVLKQQREAEAAAEAEASKQAAAEVEARKQVAAEADHSTQTYHSRTPSTTIVESFEEIADISWEWADDPTLSEEQRQALSTVLHEPETFDLMLKYFRAENERLSVQRSLANSLIVAAQKDPSKTRNILKSGIIPEEDRYLLPALPPQPEVAAATGPGGVDASGDFTRVPHQHQRMRGHSNGPSTAGSIHSSRVSRRSRPSRPSSVVKIRQFPSKLPHHGMKATSMKSSLKSSLKSSRTTKSQAMSVDGQSVRSRKRVSFANKLTRTRKWRPEVSSSSGSSAKTKKCVRRKEKGKGKAIGPSDDALEVQLSPNNESDQMQIITSTTSMTLDSKMGSDPGTPPATDPRSSRSPTEEARVWSAPPKSTYSSKSIKNIESALQKTKGMDVEAYMSHGNEERKKKQAEVEKLKGVRRHLDQLALKRGRPAQAIPARAPDGRHLDYCGPFQFLRAPEQAASANAAPNIPLSLAPKFVDRSKVYDYSHAQFAPTPRSIPDDEMPDQPPASPDQKALNEQWKKQKEDVKMDIERSRDSVREQLLSRKAATRGKTPRVTVHLNPAQQFSTATQTKPSAAGSLARTHFVPQFPAPHAIFAPSPTSNPSPSSASHEGQIEIKVSPGFDPSSIFSPGTTDLVAMLNASCDAASPARSAPTPATPAELEAPITPDPQATDVLMDSGIVDQAQVAHLASDFFHQSFFSLGPVQPHWDPNVLQQDPSAELQTQTQQWSDLWDGSEEVTPLDTIFPSIVTADRSLHSFLASSTPSPANWTATDYSTLMPMQQAGFGQQSPSLNPLTSGSPIAAPYFMSPSSQASTPLTQGLFMDQSFGRTWPQSSGQSFGTFDQALEQRRSGPLWPMDRVPSPSRTDYSDSSHQPTDPTPNQSWDSVNDSLMHDSYGNFNSYLQQGHSSVFTNTSPFASS